MELVVLLPALLVFFYSLYKFVKDDYVFIRKGVSLEQSFDIAFIVLWISLLFSRFVFLLFQNQGSGTLLKFFSLNEGGSSLTGAVCGGGIALYLIGKYKKIPLGRFSDFLSLSLLFAMPIGFLGTALLVSKTQLLIALLNAGLYVLVIVFFMQFLYHKIMNRTLREGTLTIIFMLLFSLISLVSSVVLSLEKLSALIVGNTFLLGGLLLLSIVLLLKQERPFAKHRRVLHR